MKVVWPELAQSEPPRDVQPWLDRLERWSAPRFVETFHQWQRSLLDLYTIARGLNVYIELVRRFPRFVQRHGRASLDAILRPSESRLAQEIGLDAGLIDRSLGIGANWLIRELSALWRVHTRRNRMDGTVLLGTHAARPRTHDRIRSAPPLDS